ncbi:hypothetical protein TTHERM_00424420 (macronuclear) [Tetrahymena thermophila SB210]|uniref:Uncharacterized protein n=1 Tax=Tetrahymena thermophila (strain SB210) TaxID=312017 RepID=Q23AL8_TETTS|nr:hypothetical protein TTHERM_00424420 [Tetrahymena thermophila SB210]EAR93474.1 hypothetical protein TTHERM_00424420 [Tetrahymena thermophila SB210]|eukprot:XP_001013719.1 hypothetical protein TTHERM_00424420 [Tetrahymena thermophila SB210]
MQKRLLFQIAQGNYEINMSKVDNYYKEIVWLIVCSNNIMIKTFKNTLLLVIKRKI